MSDHNSQFLRKAGFADLESALAAIESMSDEIRNLHNQMEHLERQYGFAMAERDEARREVCGLLVACHTDPDDDDEPDPNLKHIHAGIRGWDCFKENTND